MPELQVVYRHIKQRNGAVTRVRSDTVARWARESSAYRAKKAQNPAPDERPHRKRKNARKRRRSRYWAELHQRRMERAASNADIGRQLKELAESLKRDIEGVTK